MVLSNLVIHYFVWSPHLWLSNWRTLSLQCVCIQHNWNQNGRLSVMPCSAGSCAEKISTNGSVFHDAASVEDKIICWEKIILRIKQQSFEYTVCYVVSSYDNLLVPPFLWLSSPDCIPRSLFQVAAKPGSLESNDFIIILMHCRF